MIEVPRAEAVSLQRCECGSWERGLWLAQERHLIWTVETTLGRGLPFPIVSNRPTQPRTRIPPQAHPDIEVVVAFCGKELTSAEGLTTARYSNEE
jgi:hypothetical protein